MSSQIVATLARLSDALDAITEGLSEAKAMLHELQEDPETP